MPFIFFIGADISEHIAKGVLLQELIAYILHVDS
jgi:hypothetical protein